MAIKSGVHDAFGYDLHPNAELRDGYCWNVECMFCAAIFEVILVFMFLDWYVFGITIILGWTPLTLNLIWLLLPFQLKRLVVINNRVAFTFYTV